MNNSIQSSVPSHPEQPHLTQAELSKLFAYIRSKPLTPEELIKLPNFGEPVINAEIRYLNSYLVSFKAVKQPEIVGISNSLKLHVATLEKLASLPLPRSDENMRDLGTVIIKLAHLELEIHQALHKCGMKYLNTGISLLEQ